MDEVDIHLSESQIRDLFRESAQEMDDVTGVHLSQCAECQALLERIAADSEEWQLAKDSIVLTQGLSGFPNASNPKLSIPFAKELFLDPPSHPEMLGRIGRYEIERVVGSGGMGIVYKAHDSELHRSVAIKFLSPHLAENRTAIQRFSREARAAAAVVHDHVIPIYNVEAAHVPPYIVMQYIAGGSLQAKIDRDGPLETQEVLRIGLQIASGLAAAHAQGLIHRDVKPSNILLNETVSRALLSDFGLARAKDDSEVTRTGCQPGTPHYMSPEQSRGSEIDQRSDLFSFGCVLYTLCTGHPPFRAENTFAVMRRIQEDKPRSTREVNAEIPQWLDAIVFRLLEKDPNDRIQSAQELIPLFEQCIAHLAQPTVTPLPEIAGAKDDRNSSGVGGVGKFRNWMIGLAALVPFFVFGIFLMLESGKGKICIESDVEGVPIRITKSGKVVDRMIVGRNGSTLRVSAGEYLIELESADDKLEVQSDRVIVAKGKDSQVKITWNTDSGTSAQHTNREPISVPLPSSDGSEQSSKTNHPFEAEAEAKIVALKFAAAKYVADSIVASCRKQNIQANVLADERVNAIVILADPNATQSIQRMIKSLDVQGSTGEQAARGATDNWQSLGERNWPQTTFPKSFLGTWISQRPSRFLDGGPEVNEKQFRIGQAEMECESDRFAIHSIYGMGGNWYEVQLKRLLAAEQNLTVPGSGTDDVIRCAMFMQQDRLTIVWPERLNGDAPPMMIPEDKTWVTELVRVQFVVNPAVTDSNRKRLKRLPIVVLLQHADANNIAQVASETCREQSILASIEAHAVPKSIVIDADPSIVDQVIAIIQTLDKAAEQPLGAATPPEKSSSREAVGHQQVPQGKFFFTPDEAIELAKQRGRDANNFPIRLKVASVHPPFSVGGDRDGHKEGELHLDFRPLPADFSKDQLLIVLTTEYLQELRNQGVENVEAHFLNKTISVVGDIEAIEYTARAMRGLHFHLVISKPEQITIIDDSATTR